MSYENHLRIVNKDINKKKRWYFWKWDFFNFSKASVVMTIWGYLVIVLFSEGMGIPVRYSFWMTLPPTWCFRYLIYKKLWRDKK